MARQAGGYDGNGTITAASGSGTMKSEWNFDDTIRGTMNGVPINFNLDDMEDEAGEEEVEEEQEDEAWDLRDAEVEVWDGTTRIRGDSLVLPGAGPVAGPAGPGSISPRNVSLGISTPRQLWQRKSG